MGIWLLVAGSVWAGCGDIDAATELAENAAFEARVADAHNALGAAEQALGCGPRATPEQLARLWLAESLVYTLEGDPTAAREALAAAARVAPEFWVDAYGESLRAEHAALGAVEVPADATIVVRPAPRLWSVWIDGRPAPASAPVPPGLHALQVGPGDDVQFGRTLLVPSGEFVLSTGLVEPEPAPAPSSASVASAPALPVATPAREQRSKGPRLGVLGGAVAAGVVAGGLAGLAVSQDGVMRSAQTQDQLDAAFARQKALGFTSYGLGAAGAVLLGLSFAL